MKDNDINNTDNDSFREDTIDYNFAFNVNLKFLLYEWKASNCLIMIMIWLI
jgi:hypothetical protein